MKLSRDVWLMILLLVILVGILAAAGVGQQADLPALSSLSSAPDGAKALKLWLPELGFKVDDGLVSEFQPPENVDLVLMLEPGQVLDTEWQPLDDWVKAGGTLIIASRLDGMYAAATHFDFSPILVLNSAPAIAQTSPLFSSPTLTKTIPIQTDMALASGRDDFVTELGTQDGAFVVSFAEGKGRVVLCTSPYIFTNRGLKDDSDAAFVLNLLALAKPKSAVWFDEWHHGLRAATNDIVGPEAWLRQTPIGNAFLFILAVVMVGLFLQGRAFGRPVPLPREIRRRTVMEHVTALANLNRRAGHRADVLRQYHAQVKRHLGKRYRLDPSLPDEAYVDALKKFNPSLDSEKLLKLLRGLSQTNISETDMVKLAAEAAEWIKE